MKTVLKQLENIQNDIHTVRSNPYTTDAQVQQLQVAVLSLTDIVRDLVRSGHIG